MVNKLPSGVYEVRARDGRGVNQKRKFKLKRDAEAHAHRLAAERRAARKGEPVIGGENPLLSEWCGRFLDTHPMKPQSKTAVQTELNRIRKGLGEVRLRDLHREQIGRWVTNGLADYKPNTQRNTLQALRQVLNVAVKDGLIASNPAMLVDMPKLGAQDINPFESWQEVKRVAEHAGEWGPMIRFAAATGLRPGEYLALRWSDVDTLKEEARVNRTVQAGRIVDGIAKTAGSLRAIVLSHRALDALSDLVEPEDRTRLIFQNSAGNVLNWRTWGERAWTPALRGAGLAYRPPYQLRHTFATLALSADTPIPVQDVSRQLGHKHIDTTLKHYTRWMPQQDDRLRRLLNAQR